jgi:xylan 1,4-beta-xylosidase
MNDTERRQREQRQVELISTRQTWTMAPLRKTLLLLIISALPSARAQVDAHAEQIVIDGNAPAHRFPHYWEQMFGSGRAILTLRESYRRDLGEVKQITGFQYVRFHAILHDEVGVYDEDAQGHPVYNFSYVDQIYDGLLANGVKPFVELSFMPRKLAAKEAIHTFWYKQNVSPPKEWGKWEDLITAFTKHLVERYGIDEVSSWYFEVWNEPNLDFWAGDPKQATYWDLYDHTARAVKTVDNRLRVGGPATAQATWIDSFIRHCAENHVPVDFVSTHVYGDDPVLNVFGTDASVPRNLLVCRAVRKVHNQIQNSPLPQLPLIWSEFNATYENETDITDSTFMGPWIADTIRRCDGLTEMMSYWALSDVFEEQGVVKTPFYGGYGLIAEDGIPKPAFEAFRLLHKLGNQRITVNSDSVIATRRDDGTLVLAIWNYAPPDRGGSSKNVSLHLLNASATVAFISRVDRDHGDVHSAYEKMGSPRYPTQSQIRELQSAAELPPAEIHSLEHGALTLTLPSHGLAVIEIKQESPLRVLPGR